MSNAICATGKKILGIAAVIGGMFFSTAGGALAATKNVTFGWEDGTSTFLSKFITEGSLSDVSGANVTAGSELNYGSSGAPVIPPAPYDVTPFAGSRMLELNESPLGTSSITTRAILAWVDNLDPGDTVQFSFRNYDPNENAAPSMVAEAVYTIQGDTIDSFAGNATGFGFVQGTGWLQMDPFYLEGDAITFAENDPGLDTRGGLAIRGVLSKSSTWIANGRTDYSFFVDDLDITVTSENPNAVIHLPDGSMTLVNAAAGLPGDFNNDTVVGAADYDLWKTNFGAADESSINGNGNGSGGVDAADYTVWRDNFDEVLAGSGGIAGGAVPEPTSLVLLAVGLCGGWCGRRSSRR